MRTRTGFCALGLPQLARGTIGILCIAVVAAFCSVAVYDLVVPWSTASQALKRYSPHHRICLGIASESRFDDSKGRIDITESRQRSFALVRAPISLPVLVTVAQDRSGRINLTESAFGFWFLAVVIGGIAYGALALMFRRVFGQRLQLPAKR